MRYSLILAAIVVIILTVKFDYVDNVWGFGLLSIFLIYMWIKELKEISDGKD